MTLSKLRYRLSRTTFPPTNLEEILIEPSIVLAHGIMSETRKRKIIRKISFKLEGSPESSMSFKRLHLQPREFSNNYTNQNLSIILRSTLLDAEDVDLAFISRLESITMAKAAFTIVIINWQSKIRNCVV